MNWQNHPLVRLVLPFILGMIGAYMYVSQMDLEVLFVVCCTLLFLLFFFLQKTSQLTSRSTKFGVIAALMSFLVGALLYTHKYQKIAQGVPQDSTFCAGVLLEQPQEKAKSWALNIEQDNGAHIILYIGKKNKDFIAANNVDTTSDFTRFSRLSIGDTIFANITHLNATEKGCDDTFAAYHKYLFSHGICATCYAQSNNWLSHHRQSTTDITLSAKTFQHKLHNIYNEHGISGDSGNVIEAMTIGMKENIGKEVRQKYATAGTSHVLAMSGLHVGLIVMLLQLFFITNVVPKQWHWLCNICIVVLLWCFAIIAGLSPSIIRATLMFSILLICQSFTHELIPLNSCALAIAIMLCINPLYINDLGFQFSFISVASIGLARRVKHSVYPPHHVVLRLLKEFVYISFICTIATAPLVAYHFGRVPLLSVVSNIAIAPFVYIIMYGSVLWWMFLWFTPLNALLTNVLNWSADTMNDITEYIVTVPHSSIEWHPSAIATTLCYIQILTVVYILRTIKIRNKQKYKITDDTERSLGCSFARD